jgi:hypothetical protein
MNRSVMLVTSGTWESGLSASYRRAFASFGLKVVQFDLEVQRKAVAPLGAIGQRVMQHVDLFALNQRANRVLVSAATEQAPALIVVFGCEAIRPATLLQLKISVPGVKIANVFPDMVFNIRDGMFASLPLYDLFCIHTRSGVPFLKQAGCRNAFYLPLAADPTIHRPIELDEADRRTFATDLVFVGTPRPEHVELFAALEGKDLAIWGSWRWRKVENAWVRSRYRDRELVDAAEYVKANRAAKIALNPIDPLDIPGHNMRTFELPAMGAFGLVRRTEEVTELFREGETVACFGSPKELVEKVEHFLAAHDERRKIAEGAHAHVIDGGHTYRDRVRTLLAEVGLSELAE